MRRSRRHDEVVGMPMGPMIDMVFLLLVFFMVTAKPIKQESDLGLGLPGAVAQEESVDIPDEQRVIIRGDLQVVLNDLELDDPASSELPELFATLERFRKAAELSGSKAMLTIAPAKDVPHQRVVDVLNACGRAQLTNVTCSSFANGGGGYWGRL
ncbi:MAG: biopolymer transporter ExbD [Verrucomicrobiota bacterium]|nr:biopolymer transporter ExbD [Verrucomicrobiota bacterium]